MNRLNILQNQLAVPQKLRYVASSYEFLDLEGLLTPEEREIRRTIREFVDTHAAPVIANYVEKAEFPQEIVEKLKPLQIMHKLLGQPYGQPVSMIAKGLIFSELARCDAGLATFLAVQWALCTYTIDTLGSEEQRAKWVPKLRDLELIGGWGLTERDIGSDASELTTNAKKVEGGWIINGNKRWIGNGNRDLVVVWARNLDTKQVNAFIVETKTKGVSYEVIKNKLALRIVQNCQITYDNVFVPDSHRLEKANDFSATNDILAHSRQLIPFLAHGICVGVYENVVKYISERRQFKVPIASFQIQQEKMVRILANTQAIFLAAWRLNNMDQKKITIGKIALIKAWASERGREVTKLGREMLGGNGIISDNYVMRAHCDIEAIYTYEGTYDINALVAGREITGIASFKVPGPKK